MNNIPQYFPSLFFFLCNFIPFIIASHQGTIEIRHLSVPESIENGTKRFVILDCDYSYQKQDAQLVVKWFFNDDPFPIYQWIPEHNRRSTSPRFKDRIDINYSIPNGQPLTKYRAVKLLKPTTDLSGKYTCEVSSLFSQDSKEKMMLVYASRQGTIQIRNLSVPERIENGTKKFVILDCDYSFENSKDTQLVVKWFFNDDPFPIYQWIPEHNRRSTSPRFRDRIDINYSIPNGQPLTKYRAVKLLNPTTDLSGKYTCEVSSLFGQDTKQRTMVVYRKSDGLIAGNLKIYSNSSPSLYTNKIWVVIIMFWTPGLLMFKHDLIT